MPEGEETSFYYLYYFAPIVPVILFMIWQEATHSALIFACCIAVVSILIWIVLAFQPGEQQATELISRLTKIFSLTAPQEESPSTERIIQSLKKSIHLSQESLRLLSILRKKVHSNKEFAIEAAMQELPRICLQYISELALGDERVATAVDIINEVLHVPEAKSAFFADKFSSSGFVDLMLVVLRTFFEGFFQ